MSVTLMLAIIALMFSLFACIMIIILVSHFGRHHHGGYTAGVYVQYRKKMRIDDADK